MKEQTYKVSIILLLLICILAFIQIGGAINLYIKSKTHFVESLSIIAYSVSANLEYVLLRSDETFDAAIGGTRIYLAHLADYFRIPNTDNELSYNVLWKKRHFLEGIGSAYMATTSIQDKFEKIYQRHINGDELDEADFNYLSELKAALDELWQSLRHEDGSLKPRATESAYFVEQVNKFISAMYM